MDITSLIGLGVLSAALCIVVRQYKPEMAVGISIACGVLMLLAVVSMTAPAMQLIRELSQTSGIDESYAKVLFQALAVCYLTQMGADCCRDAGEGAIASRIELAGKAAITVISLPVFSALAELVTDLLRG